MEHKRWKVQPLIQCMHTGELNSTSRSTNRLHAMIVIIHDMGIEHYLMVVLKVELNHILPQQRK